MPDQPRTALAEAIPQPLGLRSSPPPEVAILWADIEEVGASTL